MNIGAIYSRLQGIQPPLTTENPAGAGQAAGRSSFASFEKALASQMTESVGTALPAPGVSASNPVTSARGILGQMIGDVQNRQDIAKEAVQSVLQGEGSVHKAMIAMEEATISFQLLAEMRNKVVESLQELMRMQV